MKKSFCSILISVFLICLLTFSCAKNNINKETISETNPERTLSPEDESDLWSEYVKGKGYDENGKKKNEKTLKKEFKNFIRIYFDFKKADQEGNKFKKFQEIKEDLEFFVSLSQKYRTELEHSDYPTFGVDYFDGYQLSSEFLNPIPLNDQEMASFLRLVKAFKQGSDFLDLIVMYPGRVAFAPYNQRYALVYTEDDSLPKYMTWPTEVEEKMRILVEKIEPHWYHVFKD